MQVVIELTSKKGTKTLTNDFAAVGSKILIFIFEQPNGSVEANIPVQYTIFMDGDGRNAMEMKANMPVGMSFVEFPLHKSSTKSKVVVKVPIEKLKNGHSGISDDYCFKTIRESMSVVDDGWKFK